jgi:hypothetical protein
MRTRTILCGALATVVAVAAVPAVASAAVIKQTIGGAASPSKVSNSPKLAKPVSLRVDTDTAYDAYPPSSYSSSVNVDFDNDFVFNTKGIPTCTATLTNTTTEQALAACGAAKVGAGSATINGAGAFANLAGVVTAFNGAPQGGLPVILLHARVSGALNTTSVLVGVLKPSPLGGDYGKRLEVTVPPLAGGQAVITHFDTTVSRPLTVKKKIKVKGKKKTVKVKSGYVTASCRDKDKLWNYSGVFNFSTLTLAQPPITTTATQPCTPIKAKKGKKKK